MRHKVGKRKKHREGYGRTKKKLRGRKKRKSENVTKVKRNKSLQFAQELQKGRENEGKKNRMSPKNMRNVRGKDEVKVECE